MTICEHCGEEYSDGPYEELMMFLEEKMDHSMYDDCKTVKVGNDEVYLRFENPGPFTLSISDDQLPDPWTVSYVWIEEDQTTASLRNRETHFTYQDDE